MRKLIAITCVLFLPLFAQAEIRKSTAEAMVICDFQSVQGNFSVAAEYNAYMESFTLYILNKTKDGSAYSLAEMHYGVYGGSEGSLVTFKGAAAKLDLHMNGMAPQSAKFLWIKDLQTFTAESTQCFSNVRFDYLEEIELEPRMTVGN